MYIDMCVYVPSHYHTTHSFAFWSASTPVGSELSMKRRMSPLFLYMQPDLGYSIYTSIKKNRLTNFEASRSSQCTAACTVRHSVDRHTRSISPMNCYKYETAFTHSDLTVFGNRRRERTLRDLGQTRTRYPTTIVKYMDRKMKKILEF